MKYWILKWFRVPLAIALGLIVNAVFFLAIPLANALFFDRGALAKKDVDVVMEVETLIREKQKEVQQKTIRTIAQPNPFKLNVNNRESNRPSGLQMDLSLARGEGGDGVPN